MSFSQAPLGEVRRKRFCNRTKFLMIKDIQSRPTRARGLKPVALGHGIRGPSSRPTRARGLKRSLCGISIARSPSRPTRARGLKHVGLERGGTLIGVAPHAGAWIETSKAVYASAVSMVAPHAGAWIETCRNGARGEDLKRRAPRGRVD